MVTARPPVHSRPTQPVARKTGGIRVLGSAAASGQGIAASSSAAYGNSKGKEKDVALYKRLFFPYFAQEQATAAAPSPPRRILQDPAASAALDVQLYNLLALIIRGFINPWFSKISRDRAFPLEILRVASHVFRQLEARLSEGPETSQSHRIDKVKLVCETFPKVFERHVRDMRRARSMSGSAYAAGASINHLDGTTPFEALFHSLQPHVAISATSTSASLEKLPPYIDADYLRAAIDALLKNLLPPEDYQAETERSVVREVILGIVLGGVFSKVAQPWFIYGLIAKLLEQSQAKRKLRSAYETESIGKEQSAWHKVIETLASLPVLFYRITAFFTYLSLLVTTSLAAPTRYTRAGRNIARPGSNLVFTLLRSEDEGRQVLKQMQWALDTSSSIASPLLDKIIMHILHTRVFSIDSVTMILQIIEGALFPRGYPAPSVPDPNEEEQLILKERAYAAVENAIPASILPYLLLPGLPAADAQKQLVKDLLDPFESHYCNLHLFIFILDLVVANLCPELVV